MVEIHDFNLEFRILNSKIYNLKFKNMHMFKKAILVLTLLVIGCGVSFAAAPSFNDNFADYLTDDTPDRYGRVETVFNICVDRNLTLMQNIKNLFYPNSVAVSSEC
jgi:hypothetical protein